MEPCTETLMEDSEIAALARTCGTPTSVLPFSGPKCSVPYARDGVVRPIAVRRRRIGELHAGMTVTMHGNRGPFGVSVVGSGMWRRCTTDRTISTTKGVSWIPADGDPH